MKDHLKIVLLFALLFTSPWAFAQKDKGQGKSRKAMTKGYKKTKSGLYYKFHVQNKDSAKPKIEEFVTVNMTYRNQDDSVVFDSRHIGQKMEFPLTPPTFTGSFEEGLLMMSKGDSASFLVSADSLYIKTFGVPELPPYIEKGSLVKFDVKLVDIRTREELIKEQEEMFAQEMAKLEQRKFQEPGDIAKYIKDNNITVEPTPSGLYYIEIEKGKGEKIEAGDTAIVHYKAMFLDGTVFDNSQDHGPIDVIVGTGMVIKGWDEGLQLMNEGGKAKLLMPSSLAYGEFGVGEGLIPPYTPLVFEVEVVEVKKAVK